MTSSFQTTLLSQGKIGEGYTVQTIGGTLHIEAESLLAKEFAHAAVKGALESDRLADILGPTSPLFSLRPLWLSHTNRFRLPSLLEVDLPFWFHRSGEDHAIAIERVSQMASRVIELGFNTLIFSPSIGQGYTENPSRISWKELREYLEIFRSKGLKVALHFFSPSIKQDSKNFFSLIEALSDAFDFLFWQQDELFQQGYEVEKKHSTEFEKCQEEIRFIEEHCKKPLIYSLRTRDPLHAMRQSKWMWLLAHSFVREGILAFSARAGNPLSCSLALHPFFSELSAATVTTCARFLPIMGIAHHKISEETHLPDFDFDFYETVLSRQLHRRFYGLGCLVNDIPKNGSFADLVLWTAGQRMWRPFAFDVYMQSWQKSYQPEWQKQALQLLFSRINALFCLLEKLEETQDVSFKMNFDLLALEYESFQLLSGTIPHDMKEIMVHFQNHIKKVVENLPFSSVGKLPAVFRR